eukprot:TRINITY_DN9760_c0_g1_i1.p1 TRINITY_DN9760_c0_g1~~TRINITY_DN9760_c0_g1_i1.p1  ORF type:complete len:172 (+),score=7.57 TRINITY_DN9760_c0_g1_i1:260-775(+)
MLLSPMKGYGVRPLGVRPINSSVRPDLSSRVSPSPSLPTPHSSAAPHHLASHTHTRTHARAHAHARRERDEQKKVSYFAATRGNTKHQHATATPPHKPPLIASSTLPSPSNSNRHSWQHEMSARNGNTTRQASTRSIIYLAFAEQLQSSIALPNSIIFTPSIHRNHGHPLG